MSASSTESQGSSSPTQAGRLDEVCDRFERAWRRGECPRIEDFLGDEAGLPREALLRELLCIELEWRARRGERPRAEDYHARFPGRAGVVDAAVAVASPRLPASTAGGAPAAPNLAAADLLLGLLAFQNNFLDREALLGALHDWIADKTRPLGQVLVARGALDVETRALLEALARKHLAAHDGDPERSLADLSSVGSFRESLGQVPDPEVQATVPHIGAGHPAETPPPPPPRPGGEGHRFRILRPHARGGLGEVFVAEDTELHREVALKEIQPSHAHDPESRTRFVLEAEVTGGLEHPGIVPVYGLGHYLDGRPYYAMRFVRGDSLREAIRRFHQAEGPGRDPGERTLALRGLLRRFVDVCNAVAYAHSRGVLHRDLKPGNVMLGPYGETLVVDWGLAKVLGRAEIGGGAGEATLHPRSGSGVTPTLQGQAHGTPAYMSPEQAAGRLDELGSASDVYSLGAMLYHLLTGRVPFEGDDVHDALRRVRLGDFPTPRQVGPAIDPALEAVCLRAMALAPADRYASPGALAKDIESWLAEEPVSAWREPAMRRLRRWSRRHRPIVTGAAGLLVAATVALAVGSALLRDANARISAEWSRAEDNYRDAVAQRKKAEANQARAEANQVRAQANYAMARDAVDRFYTQVSEDILLNEPHMDELRRELLATAREFYEGLAAGRTDDARSRSDLGHAFLQLARIGRALGAMPEAIEQVEKARAAFAELVDTRPDDTENLRALANCEEELGTLLASTGQNTRADEAYRKALELRRQLAAKTPDDPETVNELASGYNSLGRFYQLNAGDEFFRGRAAEAETFSKEALALWEGLVETHPEVPRYRNNLAVALNNLGRIYMQLRRGEEAEAVHARSLELWEGLAAEHPEVVDFQDGLALGHNNLGIDYIETGRPGPAEEHYRKALEIWQRLADQHPERIDLAVKLGGNTCNLGNFLNHSGEYERSLEWYDRASATLEGVLRREPRHTMGRDFLRNTNWGRATALFSLRRFDESLASTERALDLDDGRARDRLRLFRSIVLVNLGDHRRAVSEVEAVSDTPSLPPGYLAIDVARVLARASAAILEDPSLGPTERREQSDRLASRALGQLERSRIHGFFDVPGELASFDDDGDFDPLRTRPEFLRWRQDLSFPAHPFAH